MAPDTPAVDSLAFLKELDGYEALDHLGCAAWIFDGEDTRYVNQALVDLTGYSREELLHPNFFGTLIHPDDVDLVMRRGRQRLSGEDVPARYEISLIARDRRLVRLALTASVIHHPHGHAVLVSGTDITTQHEWEEAQSFLSELSAELGESLDYDQTLNRAAALSLPFLGDYVVIDVVDDQGKLRRVAGTHAQPEMAAVMEKMVPDSSRFPADHPMVAALSSRTARLLTGDVPSQIAVDESHREILTLLNPRSYFIVPMVADDEPVGVMAFATRREATHWLTPAKRYAAHEVARRAADAIYRARLFRRARDEIQERQRTESALAERSRWFRSLIEAMPANVFALTPDGELDYANHPSGTPEPYTALLRWQEQDLMHPNDAEAIRSEALAGFGHGEPMQFELRAAARPGAPYRWQLLRVVPVRDADDAILGWVGASVDIDEQKRAWEAEEFLSEATRVLSTTLELDETLNNVTRLCVPYLGDYCIVDVIEDDGSIRRAAGSHADTAKQPLVDELLAYPAVRGGETSASRVLATGEPAVGWEIGPDHRKRVAQSARHREILDELDAVSFITVPITASGELLGVLSCLRSDHRAGRDERLAGVAIEVAQRAALAIRNARLYQASRDMEEELREANRVKDEFLSLVSHELRTPITVVYGAARLLVRRGEQVDAATRSELAADIERESSRLSRMLDDLLALSRLELDQKPDLEPVQLARLLGQVVGAFTPLKARPPTTVTMPPDVPLALAEPGYIDHVVRNLLSNADKYSPAGNAIEVGVLVKPCDIEIHVLDRGPGVPVEEAERIFDRFFRSDRTSSMAGGAGIGLAVCKRLVGLMGGRIWASPREGGGMDIAFSLPAIGDEDG